MARIILSHHYTYSGWASVPTDLCKLHVPPGIKHMTYQVLQVLKTSEAVDTLIFLRDALSLKRPLQSRIIVSLTE